MIIMKQIQELGLETWLRDQYVHCKTGMPEFRPSNHAASQAPSHVYNPRMEIGTSSGLSGWQPHWKQMISSQEGALPPWPRVERDSRVHPTPFSTSVYTYVYTTDSNIFCFPCSLSLFLFILLIGTHTCTYNKKWELIKLLKKDTKSEMESNG